ncbi:MAG: GatB/YqeY domain-containing protein [Actinobacteria bacterium]|nr:MAG: GatB/YqeY domain-containing protein [Actinomycetota bacterium]
MSLRETVSENMKQVMKGDAPDRKLRLSTLRMLMSELRNAEIANRGELKPDDELSVVGREVKRRNEATEEYKKAGREDLADKEAAEAAILKEFLPEPLDEDELDEIIDEAIAETDATSIHDVGRVMSLVMPRVKGRADGKVVNTMVMRKLAE